MNASQRAKGSINPEYAAVCGGKLRHPNFLSAMLHAVALERKDGAQMGVYMCPFCGYSHVGTVKARYTKETRNLPYIGQITTDRVDPTAIAVQRPLSVQVSQTLTPSS